jgi:peptide deformylase
MFNAEELSPKKLILVDYNNDILRNKTELVKFPLSKEDRLDIANMLYSIQPEQLHDIAGGMAANQWGINKSIFIFCPYGSDKKTTEVIINPSYEPIIIPVDSQNLQIEDDNYEGCFSIPLAVGIVKRYINIRVKYQNEQGKTMERDLNGWEARTWQHENDHLEGILYDDPSAGKCIKKMLFSSKEELNAFYDEIRQKSNHKAKEAEEKEKFKKISSPHP